MTNNSLGDWELCIIVPPTLSSLSVEPSVRDSSRLLGWSNLRYCKPSRQRNPSNPSSHFQVLEPPPSKLDSIGLNSLNITHYRKNLKQPSPAISSLYFLFFFLFLFLFFRFSDYHLWSSHWVVVGIRKLNQIESWLLIFTVALCTGCKSLILHISRRSSVSSSSPSQGSNHWYSNLSEWVVRRWVRVNEQRYPKTQRLS